MNLDLKQGFTFFIKFSGWFEILAAIMFFFMEPIVKAMGLETIGFFNVFAAICFFFMGFLLLYSAKDLERFQIIPITSCFFRFCVVPIEFYGVVSIPMLAPVFTFAAVYDIVSATVTLILMKKLVKKV